MDTRILLLVAAAAVNSVASAQFVVDGSRDAAYGNAISIQNSQTSAGDAVLGLIDYCNGSELDNGYGVVSAGYLRLFLGGNLDSNFSKLELFLDYKDGGQNRLRGNNPNVDFNGLNRMGDDGSGNGLTFDEGFAADFYFTMTCGGGPFATYANVAPILTNGGGTGLFIGAGGAGLDILNGAGGILVGLNNTNTRGVLAGKRSGNGVGVSKGIEIAIPLSQLSGYAGDDIKVSAFINGAGHDFLSNQVLGGVGGGASLGEPRNVNFAAIESIQFFLVPGSGSNCTGDVNGDLQVDAADIALVLGGWGTTDFDLNGDGLTNAPDIAMILGAWGACP